MPGRKQPHPFDPAHAARLDDPARERWLPTQALLQMLELDGTLRVLDYGAGTGRYAIAIAQHAPDSRVTAFDIQEPMLDIVRSRAHERHLENLAAAGPSPDALHAGSFDRVLGVHLLHEIDDEHLLHVRDLLAKDGFTLLVDWERDVERDAGPPADHVHTVHEALSRLRRCGFSAEVLESAAFPYHYAIRARRAG